MAGHVDPDLVPHLDHLILLLNDPHTASAQNEQPLDKAVSIFSELGFVVTRGGRHADNLTSNALIIFPDGVYIELIQFDRAPPDGLKESQGEFEERRKKHWWYHSKPGWIDWCLLGGVQDGRIESINRAAKEHRQQILRLRASQGETAQTDDTQAIPKLLYAAPQKGGRVTLDGKQLAWNVTFPEPPGTIEEGTSFKVGRKRSAVPFYCEDLNPRDWRVPSLHSLHPNLSTGICSITLLYAERPVSAFKDLAFSTSSTLDLAFLSSTSHQDLRVGRLPSLGLRAPADAEADSGPQDSAQNSAAVSRKHRIKVHVKVADDPEERRWIQAHGEGLYEVELYVSAAKLPSSAPPDGIEHSTYDAGYGRIRLHPIIR